jgi:hypothetical protein
MDAPGLGAALAALGSSGAVVIALVFVAAAIGATLAATAARDD